MLPEPPIPKVNLRDGLWNRILPDIFHIPPQKPGGESVEPIDTPMNPLDQKVPFEMHL